ncbi:FecCD family ABC transporter permease [Corynebacterium tuberculostearicum]|uniref:FecCD family ABC transporter permease n=1 Tax=Corynebacterium tuberculostearicum TaxID=38304 RepID=UPI00195B3430|nr:iron ABC transporter permease [Corynebacterium tuberculostearicum]QRQ67304.1 iron ABC transporter permease [Corynebacterium tuberculostearicum]
MTAISNILKAQQRRRHVRVLASTLAFILIALSAYLVLLGQGPMALSPRQVIDVLTGGGSKNHIRVVWDLRLPVAIATVIVGAALGLAGSWTQTMARNPLASPDILGVTGGASVLVVLGTVHSRPSFAEGIPEFWWRACLAMIGALLVVILLAVLGGIGTSNRIVIIGIALSLMFNALVAYFMRSAQILRAAEAQTWLAGSTGFVHMEVILPLLVALAPFLAIGIWCARELPLLAHDDSSATTLGVNIARQRALLLIAATGISAVVVSVVGPIGFIALLAPHLARMVARTPTPSPLASAAAGAALLTVCAVIAGAIPVNAPVGAVSSVIGGCALVILVWNAAGRS